MSETHDPEWMLRYLVIHGYVTDAERDRIRQRIVRAERERAIKAITEPAQ